MKRRMLIGVLALLASSGTVHAVQFVLPTDSLSEWRQLVFPFNPRHSTYAPVREDGASAIRIESDNAASGLQFNRTFDTYATPVLRWSWKAMNVLAAGNAEQKEGDDYPVRIYVMFPFAPNRLSPLDRMRYEAAVNLLGFGPPEYVLNYVWANRRHTHNPIPNAYSDRGMMFFADAGTEHLGEWRSHHANIIDDFRKAFGSDPPALFSIAVMGDTDNTHGRTLAFIRDISVSSP